jgi:acetyl esterase/lipase
MYILRLLIVVLGSGAASAQTPTAPSHADLEYVAGGHARHKLDLYLPKSEKPLPVVVWIHGGAWLQGDKRNPPAMFLLEKGYAVASINYRLSQHAVFPAQIEDCKAAIRFLRANAKKYNLDGDRIGVWGSSAGGHLVALLGTTGDVEELEGKGGNADQSSRVQAVVDFFGPTDFAAMGGSHDKADSPESKLVGGAVPQSKEKVAKANPIAYVTKNDPPFLILHGDKDTAVPFNQSELLHEALKKAGVDSTFVPMKGSGHGGPAFQNAETKTMVQDFLDKHLKPAK